MATRRFITIFKNIQRYLNPSNPDSVKYNDKVSKWKNGGAGGMDAVVADMNRFQPFRQDAMNLNPNKVVNEPTVYDLGVACSDAYTDNDWEVKFT